MRLEAHGHHFCSALQFSQRYRFLSRACAKKSDSGDGRGRATKDGEAERKIVIEVERVTLDYTRKVRP